MLLKFAFGTGCEYGDRSTNFCAGQRLANCYDINFSSYCCATCWRPDQYSNNPSGDGCAYGDKATWCSSGWQNCYDNTTRTTCCQSCNKFYTGVKSRGTTFVLFAFAFKNFVDLLACHLKKIYMWIYSVSGWLLGCHWAIHACTASFDRMMKLVDQLMRSNEKRNRATLIFIHINERDIIFSSNVRKISQTKSQFSEREASSVAVILDILKILRGLELCYRRNC